VQGSGCRVQGAGFRVQGAGFRVQAPVGRLLAVLAAAAVGEGFMVSGVYGFGDLWCRVLRV